MLFLAPLRPDPSQDAAIEKRIKCDLGLSDEEFTKARLSLIDKHFFSKFLYLYFDSDAAILKAMRIICL